MPLNRVIKLLDAYFNQPFEEYGELVLEIRETGGLTPDEIGLIRSRVLNVDADTVIRQANLPEEVGMGHHSGACGKA